MKRIQKEISGNFLHEGKSIAYICIFDRFKTIRLRLKQPDLVEIKMPFRTPAAYAEKTVLKHWDWIQARREQFFQANQDSPKSETEEIFLFGKAFKVVASRHLQARTEKLQFSASQTYFNQEAIFSYALPAIQNGHKQVHLFDGQLFVQCKNGTEIQKELSLILRYWRKKSAELFLSWYYRQLWEIFREKTARFVLQKNIATDWHLSCPALTVRACKRCFGSCRVSVRSRQTTVMLSSHLMGLPLEYMEFVILHEFCHLIYPNHSPDFYALLAIVLPRHKIIRASVNEWAKMHNAF